HWFTSKLLNIETVEEYPYLPGQFDLILFCETLEHLIVNPLAVFGRLKRILKPGGHLLITLPNAVRLANVALVWKAGISSISTARTDPTAGTTGSTRWKRWSTCSNRTAIVSNGPKHGIDLT